jgi:hypothetical protein
VRRGDAEARAREEEGRRRVADDDGGEAALEARARELDDLLGVVQHDRDHRRVRVAEHAAAHPREALAEAVRVVAQLRDLARAEVARRRVLAHDDLERRERLRE